jgi:hypothetical protein
MQSWLGAGPVLQLALLALGGALIATVPAPRAGAPGCAGSEKRLPLLTPECDARGSQEEVIPC